MAEFNPEPLVWEDDRVRFTVDRIIGIPCVTLLGDKTDEQLLIATRVPADLMSRHPFIPLSDAGFKWLSAEIRIALMGAREKELERRLGEYECLEHEQPKFGECDACDELNQDESWRNVEP